MATESFATSTYGILIYAFVGLFVIVMVGIVACKKYFERRRQMLQEQQKQLDQRQQTGNQIKKDQIVIINQGYMPNQYPNFNPPQNFTYQNQANYQYGIQFQQQPNYNSQPIYNPQQNYNYPPNYNYPNYSPNYDNGCQESSQNWNSLNQNLCYQNMGQMPNSNYGNNMYPPTY